VTENEFRDDGDEHGAVIAAGLVESDGGIRMLAREVHLAVDGVDYVAGDRGYRMLTADFVRDVALHCRNERLCYFAVHNHFGRESVEFSGADLRSHERGYPALRDILQGPLVGVVVLAENAVAGDLWSRVPSRCAGGDPRTNERFDRQARLFGDRGQSLLGELRVGIIGLGGVGSIRPSLLRYRGGTVSSDVGTEGPARSLQRTSRIDSFAPSTRGSCSLGRYSICSMVWASAPDARCARAAAHHPDGLGPAAHRLVR